MPQVTKKMNARGEMLYALLGLLEVEIGVV